MEHYLDVETVLFEEVKEHVTTQIRIPGTIQGTEVRAGDTVKLYHPGDETEALRIEVVSVDRRGQDGAVSAELTEEETKKTTPGESGRGEEGEVWITFQLLEWMCRLETELDAQLREEEMWMRGLL